jgi:C-terminal processing protease CtpA/Prc
MQRRNLLLTLGLVLSLVMSGMIAGALGEEENPIPNAVIQNDEGGPEIIRGEVTYTNPFFAVGVSSPIIILEDQTGFVDRERDYLFPVSSQTLGQITSEFTESPFNYTLSLPIEPEAPLNDVDNDGQADTGVMIFAVAYWSNTFGDIFLEERDQYGGGWSTAYASTRTSPAAETRGEYTGGQVIIYAPEPGQGFPSGFGDDGMLFTEDDPIVTVPQGYTIVDMDTDPFTFDRTAEPVIDLIEGEGAEAEDYSNQSYTEAFASLINKFRQDYAFTEYYGIDWDEKLAEFMPRVEEAENSANPDEFAFVLQDFVWSIPDGHIGMSLTQGLFDRFLEETDGSIGIAIRETSDGEVLVNYVVEDSPADNVGIGLGTAIVAINGTPIDEVVSNTRAWSEPFSTDHVARLQRLRYAVRFELGTDVDVTFVNEDGDEETVTLTTYAERESWSFSSFNRDTSGYELPVEYRPLENDYLYATITGFLDDSRLTIQLWERMISNANENGAPAIIIDMRNNGGGSGFLADQMAAYFFDEPLTLGNTGFYDEDLDQFYFDPETEDIFYLPPEELRYDGEVVVLVGPNCSSACEFFSYNMTLEDRATVVGQYPTGGLGGSVEQVFMPDDISVQLTIGRAVDADGDIHIEGQGVAPDVVVPVNEETLFSDGDPILEAAIDYLREQGVGQ